MIQMVLLRWFKISEEDRVKRMVNGFSSAKISDQQISRNKHLNYSVLFRKEEKSPER